MLWPTKLPRAFRVFHTHLDRGGFLMLSPTKPPRALSRPHTHSTFEVGIKKNTTAPARARRLKHQTPTSGEVGMKKREGSSAGS